jgi:hypothetical protein
MVAPLLPLTADTVPDAIVVVAMVVLEIYLLLQILPRKGPAPTMTRMVIGSSALLSSAGLLMSLSGAALDSNLSTYTVVLLMFNFMMMGPIGIWLIALVLFQDRRIDPTRWVWPVAIAAMATFSELLMGLVFVAADALGPLDLPTALASTLLSAWYLWSMAAAMVALALWVPLSRAARALLLGYAFSGFVAPVVAVDPGVGLAGMAATMTVSLLLFLREVAALTPGELRLGAGVVAAFAASMLAAGALVLAPGSFAAEVAFGGVTLGGMIGEFLVLLRAGLGPARTYRAETQRRATPAAGIDPVPPAA